MQPHGAHCSVATPPLHAETDWTRFAMYSSCAWSLAWRMPSCSQMGTLRGRHLLRDLRVDLDQLVVHVLHVGLHGVDEDRRARARRASGEPTAVELPHELTDLGDALVHVHEGARDDVLLLGFVLVLRLDDLFDLAVALAQEGNGALQLGHEGVELTELCLDDRRDAAVDVALVRVAQEVDVGREPVADGEDLAAELPAEVRLLLELLVVLLDALLLVLDDHLHLADRVDKLPDVDVIDASLLLQGSDAGVRSLVVRLDQLRRCGADLPANRWRGSFGRPRLPLDEAARVVI